MQRAGQRSLAGRARPQPLAGGLFRLRADPPDSLATFADKFQACGFDSQSFFASYGLAEATLFVSGSRRGQGIAALELDAEAFAANRAEPGKGSVLMSCGYPQPGHAVRIVEPQRLQVLGDNQVGEIWAGGPSIALGLLAQPRGQRPHLRRDGRPDLAAYR